MMTGQRVAVLGTGRSGVSAAKALVKSGAIPIVCDEAPGDDPRIAAVAHKLTSIGAELKPGWKLPFSNLGVKTVVTSPGVPRFHPALIQAVQDGLEVISEIELAYRVAKAPIIAITGTNGKSTTTVMTWLALRGAGVPALLCGNIFGSGYEELPLTEAAAFADADTVLVAEISSFQLEWIRDFKAASAGITRIAPDHLNRYDSFEDYAATKLRIFENQTAENWAVIPKNDPIVKAPVGPKVVTFGPGGDAHDDGDYLHFEDAKLNWTDFRYVVEHNKLNAAAALLLGAGMLHQKGIKDLSGLITGLKRFHGLAHRMEWVGEKNDIVVINNSMCTNPEAVESSTRGLKRTQHLLIGGINKELGFASLANYLNEAGHSVYLYGQDAAILNDQLSAVPIGRRSIHQSLTDAFGAATKRATIGEAIVLSPGCASFDQFKDFIERGEVFRRVAKEWLG
jgi:UDP-N-acetylmuramoylalanine--D-glutamate ligase